MAHSLPPFAPFADMKHYRHILFISPSTLFLNGRLSCHLLFPRSPAADVKHYRYILKTVHAGADLDFIVEASKWVPEQAGDPATVAGMYEVRAGGPWGGAFRGGRGRPFASPL